mmetsp:Transcript_57142/g.170318  ORF Transcript_57142/g.170318 Transcript_57142/m.170318 type:complete len:287 (-) Transcript_57142:9-869(-)
MYHVHEMRLLPVQNFQVLALNRLGALLLQILQVQVCASYRQELNLVLARRDMDPLSLRFDATFLVGVQVRDELRRVSAPALSRRDARVRRYYRTSLQNHLALHDCALHDRALLADVHDVLDPAGYKDGPCSDGHVVTDVTDGWESGLHILHRRGEGVEDSPILYVRGEADCDRMARISADDGPKPDGRFVPIGDISDHGCSRSDEGVVRLEWLNAVEYYFWAVTCEDLGSACLPKLRASLTQAASNNCLNRTTHFTESRWVLLIVRTSSGPQNYLLLPSARCAAVA